MNRPENKPERSTDTPTNGRSETDNDPSTASPPAKKKSWSADQSLIATLALAVISLCALFVSIYQTRVLSMQQEVMAEQQRIMMESAKAQLWPNIEVGYMNSTAGDTTGITLNAMEVLLTQVLVRQSLRG